MSYRTQALLAQDQELMQRITACAALEGIPNPGSWPVDHRWELSATPGWVPAYASALAAAAAAPHPEQVEKPGWNESVITDAMILARVQQLKQV